MNQPLVLSRRTVGWVGESCFRIEPCAEPECWFEALLPQARAPRKRAGRLAMTRATVRETIGHPNFDDALRSHGPRGIDLHFGIVGASTPEAALRHASVAAHMAVCGMISAYNATNDAAIRGLQALLTQRIQMTGFIIHDHVHELPAYPARMAPWLRSGELAFHEDIVSGLANAPAALIGMRKGEAIGKRLVRVAPE